MPLQLAHFGHFNRRNSSPPVAPRLRNIEARAIAAAGEDADALGGGTYVGSPIRPQDLVTVGGDGRTKRLFTDDRRGDQAHRAVAQEDQEDAG